MSRTKKIAILAIIAMVLTLMPGALFAATADDNRLFGSTRIETALEIAEAGWATADAVVLAPANDANLVDALAAASLAGQENAPILLTYVDSLNAAVKARIAALGATKVYVIGAISDAVAAEVDAIDNVTVEVLKGANRIATAAAVNAKLTAPAGTFVVGFDATPDALSVASYAAKNKYAIVLANYDGSVDSAALVGATTYIVGGPTLVKDITGATRMYGADRFATNADVASKLSFSYDRVYVANGQSLVDALAVAPLAAKYDAFVALASATDVAAKSVVNEKISPDTKVIAVGGTSVVSDAVRDKIGYESSEPVTCAVEVKSYDDDTKNQYVAFTVNGKTTTVEALNDMGWDVEFNAGETKGTIGVDDFIFADQTTGLLISQFAAGELGDYYVQLTLTKDSDIVISNPAKITIKNLNLTATGISDYKLVNTDSLLATAKMNSTKLVVGETYAFEEITVTAGSSKEDIEYTGDEFSLKTSEAGVISRSGNEIMAQTPGTASITITYGNATKVISFTVVDDEREAKSIKVKKVSDGAVVTSLKLYSNIALKAEVLDQYGDPYDKVYTIKVSNYDVLKVATETVTADGEFTVTLEKDLDGNNIEGKSTLTFNYGTFKLGTFNVTVSDDGEVSKRTLELVKIDNDTKYTDLQGKVPTITALGETGTKDDFSTDTTLDLADDHLVIYQVNQFNSAGMKVGTDELEFDPDKDIVQSKEVVSVSETDLYDGGKKLVIVANETGTATVKFKDEYGKPYQVKITVVNEGYNIKSITLKTPASSDYGRTYDYKSVLNYTATGNDPIVKNVTLNKTAAQEVRFDPGTYEFYIDKNSNGTWDSGEIVVGYLEIDVTGTFAAASISGLPQVVKTGLGDEGTIIFKIFDGKDKFVTSKTVKVDL